VALFLSLRCHFFLSAGRARGRAQERHYSRRLRPDELFREMAPPEENSDKRVQIALADHAPLFGQLAWLRRPKGTQGRGPAANVLAREAPGKKFFGLVGQEEWWLNGGCVGGSASAR